MASAEEGGDPSTIVLGISTVLHKSQKILAHGHESLDSKGPAKGENIPTLAGEGEGGVLDMEVRPWMLNSKCSMWDDSEVGTPAGLERGVTGGTVSSLCRQGHLPNAVEALGILVLTDCSISKSLFYTVLKSCADEKDLVLGRRVHAFTVKQGYQSDTFLCNHILRMYALHGRLQHAMDVFTMVANPDAFMWSSIIYAYVKRGQDKQAIELYHRMRRSRVKADGHAFVAALQACARGLDLKTGQQVHADMVASGIQLDLFVCSALVDMYAKCGSLEVAQRVFDGLGQRNVVTWNAMIAGYAQQRLGHEALRLYRSMQEEGVVAPNSVTFVCLLQACASLGTKALHVGKELHMQIRQRGQQLDVFVANSLVNMYAKCGSLEDAQRVFEGLDQKDVVTWTALIAGYSQRGLGRKALHLYSGMQKEGIAVPNSVTFVCLLQACASVGTLALETGKQLHTQISEQGCQADMFVASSLVDMYAKCGSVEDAQRVFDGLDKKDVVTWTSLIAGYAQKGMGQEALSRYSTMQHEGMAVPNSVTFVCLLQACANVGVSAFQKGKELHVQIREQGHEADLHVASSLVNMYAKCGSIEDATRVFEELGSRDVGTWNAMISAYSHHSLGREALCLYSDMQEEGIAEPDSLTFVSLLQACANIGTQALETGKELHTEIRERGHEADVLVANSLVNMYAKCGSLEDAQQLFDGLDEKDVVTWTALMAGYTQHGRGQEALRMYQIMLEEGISVPNSVTFVCLLQACAIMGSSALDMGKQLHAQVKGQGQEVEVCVGSSLVNMYAKCGCLEDADRLFERLGQEDEVMWNAMIAAYSQQGMGQEALSLHSVMQERGMAVPDPATFVCLLQACSDLGTLGLHRGKQLHMQIRERGHQADVFVASSLINMYAKCGNLEDAQSVFDGLGMKNVWTWTAMIGGYSQQGMGQEALKLYSAMEEEGIQVPNSVTFVCLLQACASVGTPALDKGRRLHAQIRERELQTDVSMANSLVNMYAKCGSLEDAQRVFDTLAEKDVVTWTGLIGGYSQKGMGEQALHLYKEMQDEGIATPNPVTFVCLLHACAIIGTAALENGKQLHIQIKDHGHQADVYVTNSLINMYAKCGSLRDARRVFDGAGQKDVVMWTTLIAGYSQEGLAQEALYLYNAMQKDGITVTDPLTFVSLLHSCASVAALNLGRQLHSQIEEQGLQADAFVAGSLINMYGKSGSMVEAQQLFDACPERDVVAWSALIAGYACQGDSELVFDLVHKMTERGLQPIGVTFLSVLTVCSHAGLVQNGRDYLDNMTRHYDITPTLEHFTCMVDLLGRAGQLGEALGLVRTMPVQPNAGIWHTLLGACRKWSNVEVGSHAFSEAVKLDNKDAAAYVLMSNIYGLQMRDQAKEMQVMRRKLGAWKLPGQSWWTDMDGLVHSFLVGDKKHVGHLVPHQKAETQGKVETGNF